MGTMTSLISGNFPNLPRDDKAGDPCPCGCSGAMVLPEDSNARSFLISCPCPLCGVDRIRLQRKWRAHGIPCIKCSNRNNGARRMDRRFAMNCPDCERTRRVPVSYVRKLIKNGNAVVDWKARTCAVPCRSCGARRSITEWRSKILKRYGHRYFVERNQRLNANKTLEQRAAAGQAMGKARKGQPFTEEHRRNIGAGQITPYPAGKFGICRVCRLVLYSRTKSRLGQFHGRCFNTWRSEHMTEFDQWSICPPRPQGRVPSHDELGDSFAMCVRHLLRGEPIGEYKRGKGIGLAVEYNMTRRGAIKRIRSFLCQLPIDGRGDKQLRRWSEHLLRAAQESGYKLGVSESSL